MAIMKRQLLKPNSSSHLLHFIILLKQLQINNISVSFPSPFPPLLYAVLLTVMYLLTFPLFTSPSVSCFHGLLDYKFPHIPFNLYIELTTLLRHDFFSAPIPL